MSNLANWFKMNEPHYSSAEIELFKEFVDGKINSRPAAVSLTKDIVMKEDPNILLYDLVTALADLAIYSLDTAIQKKIVKLVSAICTIRKDSRKGENKIPPCYVLGEIDKTVGDSWSCKYLCSSFDLLFNNNTNAIFHLCSSLE